MEWVAVTGELGVSDVKKKMNEGLKVPQTTSKNNFKNQLRLNILTCLYHLQNPSTQKQGTG